MTKTTLECCPWCGSEPSLRHEPKDGQDWFRIECTNDYCFVMPKSMVSSTASSAVIRQWNEMRNAKRI